MRPIGGLCNRLRVIGSRLYKARAAGKTLAVWWWVTPECAAKYHDLFVNPPNDLIVYENTDCPVHVEVTCYVDKSMPVAAWAALAVNTFKPISVIQTRIDAVLDKLGPDFVAVHIRRTDHNERYDEDAVYAQFAQKYPESNVYAAADNPRSIVTLKKSLGARLQYNGAFAKTGIRLTSISDAVVDLWVSSRATRFRGTYWSSFSEWIEIMRKLRGMPAGDLSAISSDLSKIEPTR